MISHLQKVECSKRNQQKVDSSHLSLTLKLDSSTTDQFSVTNFIQPDARGKGFWYSSLEPQWSTSPSWRNSHQTNNSWPPKRTRRSRQKVSLSFLRIPSRLQRGLCRCKLHFYHHELPWRTVSSPPSPVWDPFRNISRVCGSPHS